MAETSKVAVLQVISEIMHNPSIILDRKYKLKADDFPEQFHKIVFGAVEHLAHKDLKQITPIDVDQYLAPYTGQYKVFCENNGMEYLQRIESDLTPGKFEYYYGILKKYSLFNRIQQTGFDIRDIYDGSLTDPLQITRQQARFENLSTKDMIDIYEQKILALKQDFVSTDTLVEEEAGDGIDELIERYKEAPEIGLGLISPIMTTVFRGRRLGTLYLESSAQGMGKTRRACGESAHLAVPWYYDTIQNKWIYTGMNEPVLFISTELEADECRTMWLAYVSGVPEDHILDYRYGFSDNEDQSELARVRQAAKYIKESKLYFAQITDYNVEDILTLVRKYHAYKKVNYVFYDYLSTSLKIMSETSSKTRISGLREDQILLGFATQLKNLCVQEHIHLQTATQLSGEWKTVKEADQQLLRGAKSISDKIDNGSILMPIRENDKEIIEQYLSKGFETRPNMVLHIYKVRRGSYNSIKIYLYFDKSTCRMQDCFVTDNEGNIVNIIGIQTQVQEYKPLEGAKQLSPDELLDTTKTTEMPEEVKHGFVF